MNDFDRLLEHQLRRKLDPVVATPAPARRTGATRMSGFVFRGRGGTAIRSPGGEPLGLRSEKLAFVELS